MGEPWILAVDLGTTGLKTGAVTLGGEVVGGASTPLRTRLTADGGAEQDPVEWWRGIRGGVAHLLRGGVEPADVIGIGITGQWGSTVPVDPAGEPAGPCLLWADTRGGRYSAKVMGGPVKLFGYSPGNLVRWVQITGGAPSPHGADPLGHSLVLRHQMPEVDARTATLLEPLDYLGLRFSGRRAATPASMVLSWLTDNRRGAGLGYVPELVRRSGRDPQRLPELVPTGSVLGGLLPSVAEELGIPAGVPVVAGAPDLHTAFLASGAVAPYQAHLTIATTAWISCEVPFKRTDPRRQMASIPGLRPGAYLVANNHETAGACLQWLRDAVIAPGDTLGSDATPDFGALAALAGSVPAGAGGVIFTPWLNGERSPVEDRTLRAAFLNVSLTTERAHLVRAVLEGVAFNARWLLDAVEKFVRRPLPALRVLGGGACSELWCQLHADVLGRRIERVADPMHATVRGAGLFAAVSLGKLSIGEVPEKVAITDVYDPDPAARRVYEPVYQEFSHLHGRLHRLYGRLNARE